MENEGFIDTMINSLKYSVSDLGALFWGGIMGILCLLLVGIPFMLGYTFRCFRNLLRGDNKLPAWDDWGTMLKDGIIAIAISLVYGLIGGILYVLVMPFFLVGGMFESNLMILLGVLVAVPVFLIEVALSLLIYISWMEYAVSGDLARAINPVNGLRLIAANPLGYILALVALFIVGLVISIPSVLIITIPWVMFATYVANAYIYARFYQDTARPQAGSPPAIPAATA
ncbi:DUF4013 domain-containing protein [Methanocella sp. MCL-LM]|uniref:DUF4013 domain-containing protein n=1 Tax=Methanocella sp. MCL-LM TaxID=3412035 RepID=UPI003C79393B